MYYRGANAAILVYDITSEESFLDMNSWIEELRKNMNDDLIIHVVGNKIDLAPDRRVIPLKRTQDYVSRILGNNFSVHEASAKDDKGIEELFLQITRTLVEHKNEIDRQKHIRPNPIKFPDDQKEEVIPGCCTS
ncbi:14117_t:CDS:2 [Entrophospora sp. SA101]|nr:14117_t:CDS:2 [Entrophospora sp. SA101]